MTLTSHKDIKDLGINIKITISSLLNLLHKYILIYYTEIVTYVNA